MTLGPFCSSDSPPGIKDGDGDWPVRDSERLTTGAVEETRKGYWLVVDARKVSL